MAEESPSQITMEVEVLPGDSVVFAMSRGVVLHTPGGLP